MAISSQFSDDFTGSNGSQPNTDYWTQSSTNAFLLDGSGNVYQTGSGGNISTEGKVTIPVDSAGIIVETYMYDNGSSYDFGFTFTDTDGDSIQIGVTNYQAQGMYSSASGKYSLSQVGAGSGTTSGRWYQLEIVGTTMNYRYSSDRINWTTQQTRTLGSTVTGETFYFKIIGGSSPYMGTINSEFEVFATDPPVSFSITESLSLSETSTNLRGLVSTTNESLSLSETWSTLRGISFAIADSLGLVESYTYLHNKLFTIAESLNVVEVKAYVQKKWSNISKSTVATVTNTVKTAVSVITNRPKS